MKATAPVKSIRDLAPLERGGVLSRKGLGLQDHVAAGFCLDMLANVNLSEVWCENQDDITLLWQNNGCFSVEFVQVKSDELNQLWTVAEICKREKTKENVDGRGTSILERSLAYDRCIEPTSFRVVTARPVKNELEILTHPCGGDFRMGSQDGIQKLGGAIREKVGDFVSENGRDCEYWISKTLWDVRHDTGGVRNQNLLDFQKLVEAKGEFLMTDQIEELYAKLVNVVSDAAVAEWKNDPNKKKITRSALNDWFDKALTAAIHPAINGNGKTVARKLGEAGIPSGDIESSMEMRRLYRLEVTRPKYLTLEKRKTIEAEVSARLHLLRADLDSGAIPDSGIVFHARCLKMLDEIVSSQSINSRPPSWFVPGFMYNITDRCVHRFRRASA